MYLKKVEIRGFKSFGDLTKIEVPHGITTIVGPNGCGKSNIADAMRWVLGEQSAKLLRGTKMQDVIFAGTQNRRGLGYAQVSITIDNSEGKLKIDYSELVISRRVYQSGESEYLINKSPCRLMDIHEIFMGTGIGKEGYSIIGQGQIDQILSSRPEERRNLFEEAAGIYKYKLRKIEAEKKLEKKQENLIRIQDIIGELESRLESLETQAEKAKQYLEIQEALKEVDMNIFILEADKIEKQLLELINADQVLQADYQQNQQHLKEARHSHQEIRQEMLVLQEKSTYIQNEIANIRMNIEKYEGNIKVYFEKISATDKMVKRIKEDYQKRNDQSDEHTLERLMLKNKLADIDLQRVQEEKSLKTLEEQFQSITQVITKLEDTLEKDTAQKYGLLSRVADMKANIDKGGSLTEQISHRKNKIEELLAKLRRNIGEGTTRNQLLMKKQKQAQANHTYLSKQCDTLELTLTQIAQKQKALDQEKRKVEDDYHQASSRHRVLDQMKNEYEGFYKSVKNILALKKKDPVTWKNIHGVVGDILKAPKDLETAVHVALGNSIQHIVTRDEETANQVIDYIKKYNLGRATFLPLSSVKGYSLRADAKNIPGEKGVIGFANTLVDYDQLYKGIIDNLLGRTILVDQMPHAILLAKKYNYRYRIVTLEGEILNPGGSITGGNFQGNRSNIFSRNREVKELKTKIHQHKNQLVDLEDRQQILKDQYKDQEVQLRDKKEQIRENDQEQVELRIEINNLEESLKQTNQQKENLKQEKEGIIHNTKEINKNLKSYEDLLEEAQANIEKINIEIEKIQEDVEKYKANRDLISSQITDRKVSLSSKQEILRSIQDQINRINKDISYNQSEDESYEQQLDDYASQKQKLQDKIQTLKVKIEDERQQLTNNNSKLEKTNQEKVKATNQEEQKRQAQETMIESNSLLQTEIYKIENKITKLELEKENIYEKIWAEYEITYNGALDFKKDIGSVTKLREIASGYRKEIRQLGAINPGAIDEYTETKERYKFLEAHEQDIINAEKTLLELIDELTSSMESIFKREFEKISTNFNAVFTELFGGGQAFLQLSDDQDVLESGIEIIAQPPGKKLQNMMLLSGGERALTAIAILFGILRLKPSPFAVLDEIEAALDDANVMRFAEYLKKMGKKMQFIIITHKKGTMAVADTIYGVTMEEQGVSKVISVQLDDVDDYDESLQT